MSASLNELEVTYFIYVRLCTAFHSAFGRAAGANVNALAAPGVNAG